MKTRMLAILCSFAVMGSVFPVHVSADSTAFSDVPADSWAASVIDLAVSEGLITGIGGGLFGYGRTMTRAEFATLLCRMFRWENVAPTSATFSDVSPDKWYFGYVETAALNGVVGETSSFSPDAPILRKDMAVMLVKALGYDILAKSVEKTESVPFDDVDSDIGYIIVAHDIGMINGVGNGKFAPTNTAKREEAAVMLMRIYGKMKTELDWLHGFYAFSSYNQRGLADNMDVVSFGWSKMEWDAENGVNLNTSSRDGNLWRIPDSYELITEYLADRGVAANLCVYMDTSGGLNELLADKAARNTAVAAIVEEVTRVYDAIGCSPYNGVTIDFEGLRGADSKVQYSAFIRTLADELKLVDLSLCATVQPVTADGIYFDGYDYREIGRLVDKVILMAHDFQPASLAGFVGTDWQRNAALTPITGVYKALKAITDTETGVEDKSKIAIAFSFSNVGWIVDKNDKVVSPSPVMPSKETVRERMNQPDTVFGWSEFYRNPYITYTNSNGERIFLWYEDSRSVADKLDLARMFGVTGASVWRLGIIPDYDEWGVMECFPTR